MVPVPAKEDSAWAWNRKLELNPWLRTEEASAWRQVRLTGTVRWKEGADTTFAQQVDDMAKAEFEDKPQCSKQFALYCDYTTMHGIRYTGEPHRTICEKVFWSVCVVGMMCTAIYMMQSIYRRWERSPVITSVSNTNFPITSINFPAVTVCTVNKAVNEKLVIQACRYNVSLTQIQTIISKLVDPEARNNDNTEMKGTNVDPKLAIKFLRLAAPKCDDYLLTCRWNNARVKCTNLFNLTLTDSGYCCTFNAIPFKYRKSDPKNDAEILEQEEEFEYLEKAVWDYIDSYTVNNAASTTPSSGGSGETNTNYTSTTYSCNRTYTEDLFPGICQYIDKCRKDPESCNLKVPPPATPQQVIIPDTYPYKAAGAGRSRGLVLMLDTLRCDAVPTDSFKGLRVFVHDPDEFPAASERGFIVAPGFENQVAILGTDVHSEEVLRNFGPEKRGCYFTDEFPLKNYKDYSRNSCVVECETEFIFSMCGCTPYFAPGNYSTCTMAKINGCVKKALDLIQKKQEASVAGAIAAKHKGNNNRFNFLNRGEDKEEKQEKSCQEYCLPSCYETSYTTVVTSAPFPNQPEPNKTLMIREAIRDGRFLLTDIGYVENSVSVLRIFFRQSSVVQYKRDEKYAWEDFVSSLGGVMGLCLGFSILSVIELIYFFTIRYLIDVFRFRSKLKQKETASNPSRSNKVSDSWQSVKF